MTTPIILPIETQHIVLLEQSGERYVPLSTLAQLMSVGYDHAMNRLNHMLSNIVELLEDGAVITYDTAKQYPQSGENTALSLPAAIRLVAQSRGRDFMQMHDLLLTQLVTWYRERHQSA